MPALDSPDRAVRVRSGTSLAIGARVKAKLEQLTREARQSTERARELRERLREATANVDSLVGEARSTLKRAVALLESEGLRGQSSGARTRVDHAKSPRDGTPPDDGHTTARHRSRESTGSR